MYLLTFPEAQQRNDNIPTKGISKKQEDSCDKTAKIKTKPKYVPGPIGARIDQAEVVGFQLAINQQDELEFRREGRSPIPLTRWGKKAWAKEIKKHINDDLLQELYEAVKPAYDNEGQEIPPRRKEMVECPAKSRQACNHGVAEKPSNHPASKGETKQDTCYKNWTCASTKFRSTEPRCIA